MWKHNKVCNEINNRPVKKKKKWKKKSSRILWVNIPFPVNSTLPCSYERCILWSTGVWEQSIESSEVLHSHNILIGAVIRCVGLTAVLKVVGEYCAPTVLKVWAVCEGPGAVGLGLVEWHHILCWNWQRCLFSLPVGVILRLVRKRMPFHLTSFFALKLRLCNDLPSAWSERKKVLVSLWGLFICLFVYFCKMAFCGITHTCKVGWLYA